MYDASFNLANRNASNEIRNIDIAQNFIFANVVACSVVLGVDYWLARSRIRPGTLPSRCVPFLAVASAAMLNVVVMRRDELSTGINVMDAGDKVI